MRVSGEYKPPSIGMRIEPYPISGPGFMEISGGELHVEGGRGIPWQVQVGGLLGLIAGCAVAWMLRSYGMTLTLVGIMVGITGGGAIGYRLAGSRIRASEHVAFAPSALVSVVAESNEVQVTIKFKKRLQTRKQCLHFRPTDPREIQPLHDAIEALRARSAA
jgi:hypothetical protein